MEMFCTIYVESECDDLLIRMFEYDAKIALDEAEVGTRCMRVELPYSGILLLRGKGDYDRADIELVTPGGKVRYPIAIRRMSDLDLEVIFEKKLYFLLPFYVFNYESRLNAIDRDPDELERFAGMYRDMVARLESEVENQCLSAFSYGVIIRLIDKVVYKMTMSRKNVQRKVGDIMGGKVLEMDIIKAHKEGKTEGGNAMIYSIVQDGEMTLEKGAERLGVTVDQLRANMTNMGYSIPE